jgi:hypothetical protein
MIASALSLWLTWAPPEPIPVNDDVIAPIEIIHPEPPPTPEPLPPRTRAPAHQTPPTHAARTRAKPPPAAPRK